MFSMLLHEYNGRESQLCTQRKVESPVKRGKLSELAHHKAVPLPRRILRKHSASSHSDLTINSFNHICYRDRPISLTIGKTANNCQWKHTEQEEAVSLQYFLRPNTKYAHGLITPL